MYRQQGVDINEKHIEVIIRQMMRKVRVEDPGDTTLLSGTVVDVFEFEDANAAVQARIDAGETELRPATDSLILMGITKASLATESWLSAASFQETTKVLTDAAIKGKVDHLVGLTDEAGYICAGEDCCTSVPGIFAVGDVRTKKLRQIVTAVADGANAVNSVQEYFQTR